MVGPADVRPFSAFPVWPADLSPTFSHVSAGKTAEISSSLLLYLFERQLHQGKNSISCLAESFLKWPGQLGLDQAKVKTQELGFQHLYQGLCIWAIFCSLWCSSMELDQQLSSWHWNWCSNIGVTTADGGLIQDALMPAPGKFLIPVFE